MNRQTLALLFVTAFAACGGARRNETATAPRWPLEQALDASVLDASVAEESSADAESDAQDAATATTEATTDAEMALIDQSFYIDRFECALEDISDPSLPTLVPHFATVSGRDVRAISKRGIPSQSYISAEEAQEACEASGKRLCTQKEWTKACRGSENRSYPYGNQRVIGRCNDNARSPIPIVFHTTGTTPLQAKATLPSKKLKRSTPTKKTTGKKRTTRSKRKKSKIPSGIDLNVWMRLNDPALGQVTGTWTLTGERAECVTEDGVYDMVGNRHEWVSDTTASGNGIFLGGYFLDDTQNGEGCGYRTDAHARSYHDYSTGFRCCKDKTP